MKINFNIKHTKVQNNNIHVFGALWSTIVNSMIHVHWKMMVGGDNSDEFRMKKNGECDEYVEW